MISKGASEYLNWYFTKDDGTADKTAVKAWDVVRRDIIMNKRFVVVVFAVTSDDKIEYHSFTYWTKAAAEQNAEALRECLGKCTLTIKLYDVEIVEVEI